MSTDITLTNWIREQRGTLPPQQVVFIVWKVAEALQQVHNQPAIHQDINPSSLLIQANGESADRFDLQLAHPVAPVFTRLGRSYPSNSMLTYMAPEQWTGEATPATDQYALAVLAYELLTGQPPFQGPPAQLMDLHMRVQPPAPSTLNPRLSATVDAVILTALAKRPQDRFASVTAFARSLDQAVRGTQTLVVNVPSTSLDGNLRATLLISQAEATSGTVRTIALPQGRRITVAVPPGAYDGQVIRLEGYGDPSPTGGVVGAVMLTIAINPTQMSLPVVHPVSQDRTLIPIISSTLSGPRSLATRTYDFYTRLSTVRKAALLLTLLLVLVLAGTGLFSLIQSHATVAMPYPPDRGTLALSDLLQNNNAGYGWPEVTSATSGKCQFSQGAYHVSTVKSDGFQYCIEAVTTFTNFAFEARMTIVQGDDGGLIFRANGNKSQFYYLDVSQDGSYALYLYVDASGSHAHRLAGDRVAAIHTGLNLPNLLAVVAQDGKISLYINHQFITSVNDTTYSSGQIGFAAASTTDPTVVTFSDARVWSL